MHLIDFIKEYPDEASCKAKFKAYCEQIGVMCAKCGSTEHYWKRDKESYECKSCGYRQGLKANTVMHKMLILNFYRSIWMNFATNLTGDTWGKLSLTGYSSPV